MALSATDSPLIAISYHVDDEKWRKRVTVKLGLAVEKFGILDDRIHSRETFEAPPFAVRRAKVLLLLISQKYMESTWIKSERGRKFLSDLSRDGLRVLSVILEAPSMNEVDALGALGLLPFNLSPLVDAPLEHQNSVFAKLEREVINVLEDKPTDETTSVNADGVQRPPDDADEQIDQSQFTIADLANFKRSAEVENAFNNARRLATASSDFPEMVTTSCLLFGIAESGRPEVDYFHTSQFVWKILTENSIETYTRVLMEEFPLLARLGERAGRNIKSIPTQADHLSPNVVKVFNLAKEFSLRTFAWPGGDRERVLIDARHLFAALLVFNRERALLTGYRALSKMVKDDGALRTQFYDFIVDKFPDDDYAAWKDILIDRDPSRPEDQPQVTDSFTQPAVAGFMADDWSGRDLLGITRDVNALASLVAAYKVEPPLSIGLFGDWGSGKSHFMRQMKKRVERLSQLARESGQPQKELGYYKNIVQIEFNAWHYIEGNLWASLVDHIFANLKLSEREDPSFAEQRRDELMQKLGVKEEIQRKIDSKVQERENELYKLRERKEEAEVERVEALAQLNGFRHEAKASLEKLSVPIDLSEAEKNLLSAIGIKIGSEISAADVRQSYLATKDASKRLHAQWQLFWTDKRVARRYLLAALLLIIAAGGPLLIQFAKFPGLPTAVASVLAFIGTFYAAAKPIWTQFQEGLKALEKHDEEIERERQQRMTELESKIKLLETEVIDAKLEGKTVGKEIEKLKADIATTTSSKIMAEFIEDRAAASDYRRHLGLLALIRRDFEKLRDLFDQQRKDEIDGKETSDDKRINRIILYIDDLDRCPPDRVVQVLQAIHLLLAFPIFVVVVGVDSRWITRSLQQSYEWLREVDEDEETPGPESRDTNSRKAVGATPHDYLEKIFQIPFWLRSMNDDACVEFLDGLTKDAMDNGTSQVNHKVEQQVSTIEQLEPGVEEVTVAQMFAPKSVVSVTEPAAAIMNDPIQSAASFDPITQEITYGEIDLAPESLTFTPFELEYMKKLVPLIGRSPRAVKRFLNCYRLIKVGLTPEEFESFVQDGESQAYKAAMILLGVITGTPAVSSYVIDHLKTWQPKVPELTVEAWANVFSRDPEMRQEPDADRLLRFLEIHNFKPSSELLIKEMINYAPRVSRFSFRVNRTGLLARWRATQT